MENLFCPIREAARRAPELTAIRTRNRRFSYAELDATIETGAATLIQAGLVEGDRVAILVEDRLEQLLLSLSVIRATGVAAILSPRLPAHSVTDTVRRSGCSRFICSTPETFRPLLPGIQVIHPEHMWEIEATLDHPGPIGIPAPRPVTIVFTSGSTGLPKAAVHTLGNHYYSALGSNANIMLNSGDSWLLSLPLCHVGGLGVVYRCITAGATIVLPEPDESIYDSISQGGVTHVSLVATQLYRYLNQQKEPQQGLKAVLLGGGAVAQSLIMDAMAAKLPIYTSYGLTETTSTFTCSPTPDGIKVPVGSGRVLPFRRLRLDRDGEILVRGQVLFKGYVTPDGIDLPVDQDGWFHTGDLGEMDDDGNLHVTGRRDNMFISGGENIQPEEVERALLQSGLVEQAIVVPLEDLEFGQRPVAFVQWLDRLAVSDREHQLRQILNRTLPRFKLPVTIHTWPQRAGGAGIKPSRSFLRNLAMELAAQHDNI